MSIGFGIIGIGGWGGAHIGRIEEADKARVAALCDVSQEACEQVAEKRGISVAIETDHRQLVEREDVDAVVVATPHHLHYQMAMDVLNAGKHLILEKPYTIRHDHALAINELAAAKGLKVTCGFSQRLFEGALKGKVAIAAGLLGSIDYIRARYTARWTSFMFNDRTSWRTRKDQAGGGILIGRGSHILDTILFLLDSPDLNEVSSTCHYRITGREVEDLATVTFSTSAGTQVYFDCSYVLQTPESRDVICYEIYGDKGGLIYTVTGREHVLQVGNMDVESGEWTDLSETLEREYGAQNFPSSLQQDFADAIINDRIPFVSGGQAARVVSLIETAYRNAKEYR